ncbi:MAG: twin-arginine translocase subunit TatC [Candidatus Karelsulcia muelleri]
MSYPFICYELCNFIKPGLFLKERKILILGLISSLFIL